ncbi:MAG: hypothetical protein P8M19_03140 [Crocinitomicaceae bacterium]|nr:hypothetical protein [Crocinitomicaceae bacterium]MDG1658061.1 hypothetical protein [Crocinitomicaceae bacterium]MDG2440644.1 hypothetical protein [Crocinitomicaceae bacterium]
MILRKVTFALSIVFLLAACSGETPIENKELKEYFSSYLNDNESVVGFGNAKIKDILNKAQYEKVTMLDAIVGGQLETFEGMINLSGPVYYAANGPLNRDAAPEEIVLFIEVLDEANLKSHLSSEMGYDLNEAKGFSYTSDGDMAMGIRENLVIIIIKPGNYDEKAFFKKAFERVDGEASSGDVAKLLKQDDGDIVVAMNIGNFIENSGSGMEGIPEPQMKEMKKLFDGAIVNTKVKFEDGKAVIQTENIFGKKLMDKMFFEKDPTAEVISHLGGGEPAAGISMIIDVKKMETFMEDIHPQAMNKIGGMQYVGMKLMAGANDLGEVIDGKAGVLFFVPKDGETDKSKMMNLYLGLESKGEKLIETATSTFGEMLPPDLPAYKFEDGGLSVLGNSTNASSRLVLPSVASNFGKSGINFFVNLEGLQAKDLEAMFKMKDLGPILKVAKSVSFQCNNSGGELVITAKKGQENILKQALEAAVSDISELMGGVSF